MSFTPTGGRNAPSASRLNKKNNDFYDKHGRLKEGYSYQGGEGMVAMGEGKVGTTRGAGKDGLTGGFINKMIYGKAPQASQQKSSAPSAPEPTPEPEAETPPPPIEYSSEIQQAKERVTAYENDVMSGNITDDIYEFDATKDDKPRQAALSFLNDKKYQFLRK